MSQLEFVRDRDTKAPFDRGLGLAQEVHDEGIRQNPGVMMYPAPGCADGVSGDAIMIAPPYNLTSEEIKMIVGAAKKAVTSTFERLQPSDGGVMTLLSQEKAML